MPASFFSVSQPDLENIGESINDSVRLADGGYLVGFSVYHNIHCLRRLRLLVHSDYYYDDLTEANLRYLRGHLGKKQLRTSGRLIVVNFGTLLSKKRT